MQRRSKSEIHYTLYFIYQQTLRKIKVLNIERLRHSENIHNDKDSENIHNDKDSVNIHNDKDSEYRNEYKRLNVIDLK
jgi:hypothetical protein